MESAKIDRIEAFALRLPRELPYLGALEPGVRVTNDGYFVRPGNASVYSIHDQCTLVKITASDGTIGWGECVSFVVPEVIRTLINQLIGPLLVGRSVHDPAQIYYQLYDLMRVRGFFGGYYHDTLAAVDIALWDLSARVAGIGLSRLLGAGERSRIPAYASGLPGSTLDQRVQLALDLQRRGFHAVKFAAAVSHEGTAREMAALREALGANATILCDMHWKYTAPQAVALIHQMQPHNLAVAEAPCRPEDIDGQARVARAVQCPIGIGEELRTSFEFLPRLERRSIGVAQPEMGRTGITAFMEIVALCRAFHTDVMPHASIGIGIFQAASLHASAVSPMVSMHEYQHSIFDANLRYIEGNLRCEQGWFQVPTGPGLGVVPREDLLRDCLIR
ncbi:MAG TPA: mandelate racemase/muconate lactonizing enzyme family protein [Tepidisphaeraceae bacterium]|nr:mandelate racemase/muconate lactonizing enzyme family protein [Tepidisphaeraceae bacterium]